MKINDKRKDNWRVIIGNEQCPFLTYPRSDVACSILEDRPGGHKLDADIYCYYENCPRREI